MTIAFWCVLAGILLPYLCFGLARNKGRGPDGRRLRDNRQPREFPEHIDGFAKRAWNAHLNAFEALPSFAVAAIIAHVADASQPHMDLLATIWVLARIAHMAFYLADKSTPRTFAQIVSLLCVLGLFAVAALADS